MSLVQLSRDYGRVSIGAGLIALSVSLGYTAHGAFSRIDDVMELADKLPAMTAELDRVRLELRQDLADAKAALPAFGEAAGVGTANAISTADELLRRDGDGLRGKALDWIDKLGQPKPD